MKVVPNNDRIEHLRELLGPAVLLPWPRCSKGTGWKWKHRQLTDMNDEAYLTRLERAGNIGVALGAVSNGLVTIDLDDDNYVGSFLQTNPELTHTLRTRGSRGCNIWLRFDGEYPPRGNLKSLFGTKIGEWRADGNQTIVAGTHPSGARYQFVVEKPVITIDYKAIVWPNAILPPHATESKRVRGVGEDKVVCVGVSEQIQRFFPTDVISHLAPKDYHQNNDSLFKLARLVRSYEKAVSRPATARELEIVFDRWCLVARKFWRPGLTRDDYYTEFLDAYGYARMGLDENPLEVAVCRAKAAPFPHVQGLSDERIRLLVAICQELQEITGANPFFAPTRKLGHILNVHWTQAAKWLRVLKVLGTIQLAPGETRKRGGNRSPRYLCRPQLRVGETLVSSTAASLSESRIISKQLALPARAGV